MKEYKYTIIRRESRNPKRNREGRGISQSDIEALKQELAGESRGIVSAITDRDLALDGLTLTSTDLSERLKIAEESVQSHGKTLSGQAQALASQAQLLADQGKQLTTQGESLSSQSQRLATAEEALTGKLDSDEFGKWRRGELAQSLASKQPAGSYVVPSQLATSQQQAVAEAVKRAGEMDKQIKVGGRNLLRDSGRETISKDKNLIATYELADLGEIVEGETYHVKVWATVEGEDNVIRLYNSYHPSFGTVTIENGVAEATFKWDNYYYKGVPRVGPFNIFRREHFDGNTNTTITIHKVKLERGIVATDWTPAPEDVEESISTVNTSLVSLASTLLDPTTGEIHKLTSQLESHKTATDKSFAELSEHPLTIDENGYWQIWSVKDSKYLTTQYPSQGEPGHSPKPDEVLSTDSFRKQLTSKVTSEVTTQVAPVNQRIDAVKETADQTSTDLATANTKLEAVETKADNSLTGLSNLSGQVSRIEGEVQTATQGVSDLKTFETSATSQLSDLDKRSLTTDQKRDLGYLTNSLQVLRSAGNNTLEGLALQRLIALSSNNETISAYLASNALPAVLKAGITNFGTANEREQVEITHQGTGHFGNLYFAGDTIDFRKGRYDAPYLSIGAEESEFIDNFIATARLDDTPVSVGTVTLSESSKVYERTISVDNTGTRLTVVIDQLTVRLYNLAKARLLLDGEELASWQGSQQISEGGGFVGGFKPEYKPYEGRNLSYERVVTAGSHTLRLEIAGKMGSGDSGATVKGLQVRRRYDTGAQQSALTKSGLRLFGSPDRYFDVDYRREYTHYWPGIGNVVSTNPYLVRIKGGAKVDKLTADEVDAPGVPLCGASFNVYGTQIKAFGERAKRQGYNVAQAVYYDSGRFFRVYHSIGHTNYLPTVQVIGSTDDDINWNLTARIYAVNANDFAVRIITNGDNPIRHAFSFVAFKTM